MAGLIRKTLIAFGLGGPSSSFGQFGSKEAGTPQTSQDPTVIQALAAWQTGWQNAVVAGNKAAYLEDMNGICLVLSYMSAYILQMGTPEYDASTLYFTNSIVMVQATGQIFQSQQGGIPGIGAGQSGHTPPAGASDAFWRWVNPPQDLVGTATLNFVPKVTSTAPANGVAGSATLGNSAASEDGVNFIPGLPIKFPDNSVQSTASVNSNVSVQNVVTGSRAFGTNFHNTGTKPLFVTAVAFTGAGPVINAYSDSSPTPTTLVCSESMGGSPGSVNVFFIVLPGNYYRVDAGGSSLTVWTEWQ